MNIKPFRGWRYNDFLQAQLAELTAPLSETNLQQKQAYFYQQPFHYFHISAPIDVPPYDNPQRRAENWKLDKVIQQDRLPCLYAYSQTFTLHKEPKVYTQVGVVCLIEATEYAQKIVLPHENTIPKAVKHRQDLLEATRLHTVPTHLLYTDKNSDLDQYLWEALAYPLYEIHDKNDTLHKIAPIQDRRIIELFASQLADKQAIIADGHHRYESSVAYRQGQVGKTDEDFGFHLAWLTNTATNELGILPTHRLAKNLANFNQEEFLIKLAEDFDITPTTRNEERGLAPAENLWTFLLILPEKDYLLCLKSDAFANSMQDTPEVIKRLDLSVMHHFIFDKQLGLRGEQQYEYLDYTQYISQAYKEVKQGTANFALLTRRITVEEIEAVCKEGYTMPAKATYFFPKVLGGMIFANV
jgi:uncharacterized protein (DUF1015 family)